VCAAIPRQDVHGEQDGQHEYEDEEDHTDPLGAVFRLRCLVLGDRVVDTLDLDTIAAAVGESKFRLLRRFRAATGMTPHQFLVSIRVAHARRLLAAGVAPSGVAPMTGFADQSHLTRRFRGRIGFTPGRYRERAGS
jgi:AraC-like DNA-binding protein